MPTDRSHYEVTREADIPAPPQAIYDRIIDFHRWTDWSPWEDIDPKMYRGYEGADSGVGARYEWSGNSKAGTGRMDITAADPPNRIEIALEFIKPFKSQNTATFELRPVDGGTHVTWRMVGPTTWMTRFMGIFMSMDKMVGRDFEKGLARLSDAVQGTAPGKTESS
jgi:uncharacterized protein YndB with AHSA1/START domain